MNQHYALDYTKETFIFSNKKKLKLRKKSHQKEFQSYHDSCALNVKMD